MSVADARQRVASESSQQCRVSRKYRRPAFGNQSPAGGSQSLMAAKSVFGLQIWWSLVGFFRVRERFLCQDFTGLRD